MHIDQETDGSAVVLSPHGRLDATAAPVFEEAANKAVKEGATGLVFDFANLSYISSAGLRVILIAAKALKPIGGKLAICHCTPDVKKVIDLTGFGKIAAIMDDRASAVAHVGHGGS